MNESVPLDPRIDHPDWTLETGLRCTHDLDGRLLAVSAGAAQALGFKREELLRISLRDLIAAEFRDRLHAYLGTVRREGIATGLVALQTSVGVRRVWDYRSWLHDKTGVPVVIGAARDVTEQVQSQQTLRASEGLLCDSVLLKPGRDGDYHPDRRALRRRERGV